ncbi:DUF2894 domain-containing protein [Achromobacter sp. B7]|nr:DUF2894 domain-containing protein [Achromobacter sp. B7]
MSRESRVNSNDDIGGAVDAVNGVDGVDAADAVDSVDAVQAAHAVDTAGAADAADAAGVDVPTLAAQATLDAWGDSGADRLDPVRFRFLQAMARRTAPLQGLARQQLEDKLDTHLRAYAQLLEAVEPDASTMDSAEASPAASATPQTAPAALTELLAYLTYPDAPDNDPTWDRDALGLREAYPDVQMLEYFRGVWSRVSADRQVRQSQEQVHKNAGPLNSNQLVHRALSLMRELSPGYLQQFLSYTDALMWMEQIHAATAPAPKESTRSGAAKKTSRAKARQG